MCESDQGSQVVAGLSHAAIRTRSILDSVRFYTEVLGLLEAFRMHREDGSLATVYVYIAPGQYLELFSSHVFPDSLRIAHSCYTDSVEITAWKRPDGTLSGVLVNRSQEICPVCLRLNGQEVSVLLYPRSLAGFVIH